jgi:hypothetical protein
MSENMEERRLPVDEMISDEEMKTAVRTVCRMAKKSLEAAFLVVRMKTGDIAINDIGQRKTRSVRIVIMPPKEMEPPEGERGDMTPEEYEDYLDEKEYQKERLGHEPLSPDSLNA